MKQYDSVAGVKPPFVKVEDVSLAFNRILYAALNVEGAVFQRIEEIITDAGFENLVDEDDMRLWSDDEIIACAEKHYDFEYENRIYTSGIDYVWFNYKGLESPEEWPPNYAPTMLEAAKNALNYEDM